MFFGMAYATDLRKRVVAAVQGGMPRTDAVTIFRVSLATLKRWLKQDREQ
jgi:transposase